MRCGSYPHDARRNAFTVSIVGVSAVKLRGSGLGNGFAESPEGGTSSCWIGAFERFAGAAFCGSGCWGCWVAAGALVPACAWAIVAVTGAKLSSASATVVNVERKNIEFLSSADLLGYVLLIP